MHICFLCNEYPPLSGGIGTFTATLGRALVRRGHRVTVLGVYDVASPTEIEDQGVRVVQLPHGRLRGANLLVHGVRLQTALSRIHRAHPIDLVEGPENGFALSPPTTVAPRLIRMHGGHRFFTTTTGHPPRLWRSWLESRSFRVAEHLCAVSHFVADTTRTLVGLGNRRIEVIPNPVDVTGFRLCGDVSEQEGVILFVGAVREKKGARQLIQAMPEIVRAVPHAQLWVVGPDVMEPQFGGSFTAHLRSLLPEGLQSHVLFKGPVAHDAVAGFLARASVCVYPSHSEAMPIAWLEAMAAGKALVASQSGPGPELIEDGVCGLFCDPLDPASIARAVILLLRNPELRHALGRAARARAVSGFSVETLVERNEAFYRRCIRGHAIA